MQSYKKFSIIKTQIEVKEKSKFRCFYCPLDLNII